MKKIYMSGKNANGRFVIVDDGDYEWLNSVAKWRVKEDKDKNTWYAIGNVKNEQGKTIQVKMHRLIMGVTDPDIKIDHINRRGWDNRRENLRVATNQQNGWNASGHKDSLSKYKGVSMHKYGRWRARITVNGKEITIGDFLSEEDAAYAYDAYARHYFGEFAYLNFPNVCYTIEDIELLKYKPETTSKYIGVTWDKQNECWVINFKVNGKSKYLGRFQNEVDAAIERDKACIIYGRTDLELNFPDIVVTQEDIDRITRVKTQTSKYIGVTKRKGENRWYAQYKVGYKKWKYIGRFADERVAAIAHDIYAVKLHGRNARLNFPDIFESYLSSLDESRAS